MADSGDLYMVRMEIRQPALMRLGKRKGLPLREVDPGYLVHCFLGEIFGDDAPKPFDIRDSAGRLLEILGYTTQELSALRQHADAFADPAHHEAFNWEEFHQKRMPETWSHGLTLGFETRVCPVVRAANDTEYYSQGSEVDAFLTRCAESEENDDVPSREEVYRAWLADHLERRGGAKLLHAALEKFQLRKLTRRTHGPNRKARVFTRPDVRIRGKLRISEPAEFHRLLATGVGRHRSFGFGMLLLRPAT